MADGVVHALGLALGIAGAIVLVGLALFYGNPVLAAPLFIYAAGLVAMLGCSAAYNLLRTSRRRDWLRRFDHAAIFAMIAGTYTPFTILGLQGGWSAGLTVGDLVGGRASASPSSFGSRAASRPFPSPSISGSAGSAWWRCSRSWPRSMHRRSACWRREEFSIRSVSSFISGDGCPITTPSGMASSLVAAGVHYLAVLTVLPALA